MIYLQIKKKIQEGKKNIKNVFEVQVINYFTTHHFSLLVMKTTNETGKKKKEEGNLGNDARWGKKFQIGKIK